MPSGASARTELEAHQLAAAAARHAQPRDRRERARREPGQAPAKAVRPAEGAGREGRLGERVDQHERAHRPRAPHREGERQRAPHAVADQRDRREPERGHELVEDRHVVGERVAGARLGGSSVAEQVHREHLVLAREPRHHVAPDRVGHAAVVQQHDRVAPTGTLVRDGQSVKVERLHGGSLAGLRIHHVYRRSSLSAPARVAGAARGGVRPRAPASPRTGRADLRRARARRSARRTRERCPRQSAAGNPGSWLAARPSRPTRRRR